MRKALLTRAAFGLALAAIMLTGAYASAATITWGTATDVNTSALTDFSTAGTFFDSGTLYPTANVVIATTPSITFRRRDTAAAGHPNPFTFVGSGISNVVTSGALAISSVYLPVNDYQRILSYGTFGSGTRDLTISNLVLGNVYQVQLWTPYWNHDNNPTLTFTAGNSVTLNVGYVSSSSGPVVVQPQFVIGSFIADSTSQAISWTSVTGDAIFGAIQVRDLTVIPEPSAMILLGFGSLGMLRFVRRRQKQQVAEQVAK
jgi:hypothetical protein